MKAPDFDSMTKEELAKLLKEVRNSLIGCEETDSTVLCVSKLLSVDQTCGADNEVSK